MNRKWEEENRKWQEENRQREEDIRLLQEAISKCDDLIQQYEELKAETLEQKAELQKLLEMEQTQLDQIRGLKGEVESIGVEIEKLKEDNENISKRFDVLSKKIDQFDSIFGALTTKREDASHKPDIFSVVNNFGGGITDAGKDTVTGVVNIATHPIQTGKNVWTAVSDPVNTGKAIWDGISTAYTEDVINGDANSRAHFAGKVVGEIGLGAVGTKGVDKAVKFLKGADTVTDVTRIGKGTGKLDRPVAGDNMGVNFSGAKGAGKVEHFGPLNKGPLPDDIANTFRSGTYSKITTSEDTILYRTYGGEAGQIGRFWTKTEPAGPVQSIVDTALDRKWGNTATEVVKIKVPKGTEIFDGYAAPQGGLVGGGNQVWIQNVNPDWIIK